MSFGSPRRSIAIAVLLAAPVFSQPPPNLSIRRLSPESVVAGSPEFTMEVHGTGFQPGAVVLWRTGALDPRPLSTQWLNPGLLRATVSAALVPSPARVVVAVQQRGSSTPSDPPHTSNTLTFTIHAPSATGVSAAELDEAIAAGRLLPGSDRSAFLALRQAQRRLRPPEYAVLVSRLARALEERGESAIRKYMEPGPPTQEKAGFTDCAAHFGAARLLTPESVYLEAREAFCLGMMRISDKDYRGAGSLLERAVRLDSEGAYSHNALGIAALEQAQFQRAALAFREASKRAPYWAYPRHNLALTYTQSGDYAASIRTYLEAMKLAPTDAFLPYNLGLVYQRVNRLRDAEAAYKQALALKPRDSAPLNALGSLSAAAGNRVAAERYYKEALALDPGSLAARHNLALLLAARKDRTDDAIALWRENLAKDATHLPSRLSLARALAGQGKSAEAVTEYERVIKDKPDYIAARIALAGLQAKAGQRDAAIVHLREALRLQEANPEAWEQLGDLEKAAGRQPEAKAAYGKALELATDGSTKKRIRAKL